MTPRVKLWLADGAILVASIFLARRQRMATQSPIVGTGGIGVCVTATDKTYAGQTACDDATVLDQLLGGVDQVLGAILSWAPSSTPSGGGSTPIGGLTSIGDKPDEQHPGFGFYEDPAR